MNLPTLNEYLDRAKVGEGLPSDAKLAEHFGVSRNAVSLWRKGKAYPSDAHALELARIIEEDPGLVMLIIHGERAEDPDAKLAWIELAGQFAGRALRGFKRGAAGLYIILSVGLLLSPVSVDAASGVQSTHDSLYIIRIR